jgi:hypothetical protein
MAIFPRAWLPSGSGALPPRTCRRAAAMSRAW